MTLLAAARTLDMPSGNVNDFLDWWVVLRSLLDARAVHTAGDVTFTDRDGGSARPAAFVQGRRRSGRAGVLPRRGGLPSPDRGLYDRTKWRKSRPTWMPPSHATTTVTDVLGGRPPPTARRGGTPAAVPGGEPPRPRPCSRTSGSFASPHSRAMGTCRGTWREQDRGARQAHRRRQGHFRPAVAQGLQPRAALVTLLQPDGWDLGHWRRRTFGPARGRGRFSPSSRPARILPRLLGPAGGPRSRPASATSPFTARALCT